MQYMATAGCMMFGREREQAGILIESAAGNEIRTDDQDALVGFRDKIWCVLLGNACITYVYAHEGQW